MLTLAGNITEDAMPRKLIKSNRGTLILSGSNSFTGGVAINPGTSVVQGAPGNGVVQLGMATALHPANTVSFAPGEGFTGILRLAGNHATVAGLSATGLAGGAIVENASATPATLTMNNAADYTFDGTLASAAGGGPLSLAKSGPGTLVLTGSNTYTGGTKITAGRLLVNGSHTGGGAYSVGHPGATLGGSGSISSNVLAAGTIAPGNSPGIMNIDGNLAPLASSTLEIEVGGLTPGTQHDQLQVSGSVVLGGRLVVPIINEFVPAENDEITFLTSAGEAVRSMRSSLPIWPA